MDDSDIPMATFYGGTTDMNHPHDLPPYQNLPDIQPNYGFINDPTLGGQFDPTSHIDTNMLPQFDPNMPMMGGGMMPMMPGMPPMPIMPGEMDYSVPMGGDMGMNSMHTEVLVMPEMPRMPEMPVMPQPQTITIQIDSNEHVNRGRGRGRGRGRPQTVVESVKIEKKKPKVPKKHLPIFILGVSALEMGLLVWTIILNGGFESPSLNPMLGPSTNTLIQAGAKYAILTRDYNQWWRWKKIPFFSSFPHSSFF